MAPSRPGRQRWPRQLRDLITAGRAEPGFLVSHEPPLTEAASGYKHVDAREDGRTKVLLRPAS